MLACGRELCDGAHITGSHFNLESWTYVRVRSANAVFFRACCRDDQEVGTHQRTRQTERALFDAAPPEAMER
ncbi:Uu.00g128310.m01.CDS01 [Anthostomella pinea]|uniref:Uu.00g128310.m01.CDS01 n=1 Tax=Anthostomella pinea TaxID=933095 RepID=A0AAI8VCZ3_9PEZI|nr:Uu.00g128310.m01.CDS01 [Anthostomella pinea]